MQILKKEKGKTSVKGNAARMRVWIQESWDVWEEEEFSGEEEGGLLGQEKEFWGLGGQTHMQVVSGKANFSKHGGAIFAWGSLQ